MAAESAPAFQFYPRDFLSACEVKAMTLEQVGAYIMLLCWAWQDNGLDPDHLDQYRRALRLPKARWERVWAVVGQRFSVSTNPGCDHNLRNAKQECVRTELKAYHERQQNAGKHGAEQRYGRKGCHSTAMPPLKQPYSSSSASASSVRTPMAPVADAPGANGFDAFWTAYPKRKAKPRALKAWKTLKPSAEIQALILQAVTRQRTSPSWTKDGGEFIPYPATWLRGRQWEDEADVGLLDRPPRTDWYPTCEHDPKCDTGPMHNQRVALDEARQRREVVP
jgi:uncharacterized protein YdaU (DUF1376 family)